MDGDRVVKRAILISGGIDSVALTYWKRPEVAFTLDYGQASAGAELRAARKIAELLCIDHHILRVNCSNLGSGVMAGGKPMESSPSPEWWPFRNQLLATLAGMKAIQMGISELMFGCVKTDGFHMDGTREFYDQINGLVSMQEGGIKISVPAIDMESAELVKKSGIDISMLAWAHSCHVSDFACGDCRGCYKHQTTMQKLGYGYY